MTAATASGLPAEVPTIGGGYQGPFPPATVASLRRLMAGALVDLGASQLQVDQIMGMPTPAVGAAPKARPGEFEEPLPPDEPPGFEAPGPHQVPESVEVSAMFVRGIKARYLKGADPDCRRIGSLADVSVWLEGLQPGKVNPRKP